MADFAYKRDVRLQERLTGELRVLIKATGNSICAECSAKRTVRFCSITLGVFLCNRCFALHRGIGAHITRTKCIGLDAWAPEEVLFLRAKGNLVVNAYYEAMIPAGCVKPIETSPDRDVERWIKDKYEKHRFVHADSGAGCTSARVNAVDGGLTSNGSWGTGYARHRLASDGGAVSSSTVAGAFPVDFEAAFSTESAPAISADLSASASQSSGEGDLITF